jgi:hypothetical protein
MYVTAAWLQVQMTDFVSLRVSWLFARDMNHLACAAIFVYYSLPFK